MSDSSNIEQQCDHFMLKSSLKQATCSRSSVFASKSQVMAEVTNWLKPTGGLIVCSGN